MGLVPANGRFVRFILLPVVKIKTVIVDVKGEQVPSIAGLRECWRQSRLAADYVRMKLPSCFRITYGMFLFYLVIMVILLGLVITGVMV